MSRPDPITILVRAQEAALIAHGVAPELARDEAEGRVAAILIEMNQIGLADVYLGVALRRARVYQLRCQGVEPQQICERVGVRASQAKMDYRAELDRRRSKSQT